MALVEFEIRGAVALITLNRPERRNAVTSAMTVEIKTALRRLEQDRALRCAVLTGAGKTFCAGMDLAAYVCGDRPGVAEPDGFAGLVRAERTKPIIAAVNGGAFAGGFEIVLACDMAVADAGARFSLPEVKRGLIAGGGGAIRLPRRVPFALANEMLLTGDPIDAERALALGLVNALAPPGGVVAAAMSLAERIVANAPVAVAASLALTRAARLAGETELWAFNDRLWARMDGSPDTIEGARAFSEKRAPKFMDI